MSRARTIATLLVAAPLALWSTPAGAHVAPSITEVPAGSAAVLEFVVEHGCDGAPTERVEFQVPDEVSGVTLVDTPGWTGSIDDRIVTYEGGPLASDAHGTFGIGFTAPDTVGTVLRFPVIQTCTEGSIDWIQTDPDDDRPAPSVEVVAADPDAPMPTEPTQPDAEPTDPEPTDTTVAPDDPEPEPEASEGTDDDESDDSARAYVIGGVVVAIAIGGVLVARQVRRNEDA